MLTFCDLQESAVRAIIGSPFVVVEQVFTVERERPVLDFPKSPVTSRAFWFLRFGIYTLKLSVNGT